MSTGMPATIGEAIDLLYTTRASRLSQKKELNALEDTERALKLYILTKLKEAGQEGARAKLATASIVRSREAIIEDWDALHAYVEQEEAWELLQKRVSITAMRERWDAGVKIPGVEFYEEEDLSLAKASAKSVK